MILCDLIIHDFGNSSPKQLIVIDFLTCKIKYFHLNFASLFY